MSVYKPDEEQPVISPCCEPWAQAHQWGTGNEGYSSLIYWREDGPHIGYTGTGGALPVVRFCPWCGAKKEQERK